MSVREKFVGLMLENQVKKGYKEKYKLIVCTFFGVEECLMDVEMEMPSCKLLSFEAIVIIEEDGSKAPFGDVC